MSPESSPERLARAEARLDGHDKTIAVITPLVAQYAVQEERISGLRGDLNDGLKAIREELAELKADAKSRAKERRTMLVALLVAGIGLVGTFLAQLIQTGHHP